MAEVLPMSWRRSVTHVLTPYRPWGGLGRGGWGFFSLLGARPRQVFPRFARRFAHLTRSALRVWDGPR